MGRATDLTVIEKSKIIGMRQEGFSFSKISLAVGRSVNAVKHVIGNFTETEVIGKREVTKLVKRKISDRTARYLQLLSKRDRRKTLPVLTQEISLATSNNISLSSVRRSFRQLFRCISFLLLSSVCLSFFICLSFSNVCLSV